MKLVLNSRAYLCACIAFAVACSGASSDPNPTASTQNIGGDGNGNNSPEGDAGPSDRPNEASSDAAAAAVRPLYALANEVYTADDSTTYVNVLTSLDIDELDYSQGIEYAGGRATIATRGGFLYVAHPQEPVIDRFTVGDEGGLTKDKEVSFANYGAEYIALDDWSNTFINDTKAYLFNTTDGTTIIWNPSTMRLLGEVDNGEFDLIRDGSDINGSDGVVQGNRLYRTIFWTNWDDWHTSEEQYLAIYDTDTDQLIEMIEETRCPGLGNRIDHDEAGNLYFSNWIWNVGETLVSGAPSSCALRMLAGEDRFDQDWILPYPSVTDGREAAMFAYLGDNNALLSVFHDERVTIDDMTLPDELASTDNWRVWQVDLESRTGAPLEGLPWMAGAASTYHIDDRSFMLVPTADWSRVDVYEIGNEQATHRFGVDGWVYLFFRIN